MSAKEDIARIVEEVWNDETSGAEFQKSVRGTAAYDLNHRVRVVIHRMVQDAVINDIVAPYVKARVAAMEPAVRALVDRLLQGVIESLPKQLADLVFETANSAAQNNMQRAVADLGASIKAAVYRAFECNKPEEPK